MNPATDDDSIAEALADAWVERAAGDPALRRLVLRAAGLIPGPAKPTADMSIAELAAAHDLTERRIRQLQQDALFKLRHNPLAILALRSLTKTQP